MAEKAKEGGRPDFMVRYPNIRLAYVYAYKKHHRGRRKGTEIPYVVHPMDVASILMKELDSPEDGHRVTEPLIVAGLLHDLLEDTPATHADIERKFGADAADLVRRVSEPDKYKNPSNAERARTWKERKTHTIEAMRGERYDVKLLSCADKLANIRDIITDRDLKGESVWDRFNTTKAESEWYYRELDKSFQSGESIAKSNVYRLFKVEMERLFGKA